MASKWCKICNNLLLPNYLNDELTFKCEVCHISYESDVNDTLRKERTKENDIMVHEMYLNRAAEDPATIKARIDCISSKCKGTIVRQVRTNVNMHLYNICILCNARWLST